MTADSRNSAMANVIRMVEDYIEEIDRKDSKEVEVKMRFLMKLDDINKLSKDVEKEMKVSLKGDVMQIRRELEAGTLKNEDLPDEIRKEIYEEIFPEIEVKLVVEEEENTSDWMKRCFKSMNESKTEKEMVSFAKKKSC
jgi:hypothetical protein